MFLPDLVTVIRGGVQASQSLLAPPFDHIFTIGSQAVGKTVLVSHGS